MAFCFEWNRLEIATFWLPFQGENWIWHLVKAVFVFSFLQFNLFRNAFALKKIFIWSVSTWDRTDEQRNRITIGCLTCFLPKFYFLNEKFTYPTFSPGIVQFEVANYSAEFVFPAFAVENFNLRFSVYEGKTAVRVSARRGWHSLCQTLREYSGNVLKGAERK